MTRASRLALALVLGVVLLAPGEAGAQRPVRREVAASRVAAGHLAQRGKVQRLRAGRMGDHYVTEGGGDVVQVLSFDEARSSRAVGIASARVPRLGRAIARARAAGLRAIDEVEVDPEGLRGQRYEQGGGWYSHERGSPTVRTRFRGRSLGGYVDDLVSRQPDAEVRRKVDQLQSALVDLVRDLRRHQLAHGNLNHRTIRVVEGADGSLELRLIGLHDMWSPELDGDNPAGPGDADYQHPTRGRTYGPDMDNFPAAVIYTALEAIAARPSLRDEAGRAGLLFDAERDLRNPRSARSLLARIADGDAAGDGQARAAARRLRGFIVGPGKQVPTLDRFVAAVRRPERAPTPVIRVVAPALAEKLVIRGRFASPELRGGELHRVRDFLDLVPWKAAGEFATVFRIKGKSGRDWAVRIFTDRDVRSTRRGGRAYARMADRYEQLAGHIDEARRAGLTSIEPIEFARDGVELRKGVTYPTVTTPFIHGETLGDFVDALIDHGSPAEIAQQLDELKTALRATMVELRAHDIAHGDLQHDNIMVVREGGRLALRLIDLDGAWTPSLAKLTPISAGHPDYSHPRRGRYYGRELDNFSAVLIYTALDAISADPDLYRDRSSGRSLLFSLQDLADPEEPRSTFERLRTDRTPARVRTEARLLRDYLDRAAHRVPTLEAFVAAVERY